MRALLPFFLLLIATSLTFAQPRRGTKAGPCSCDDLTDLINRLNEVDAAIAAYAFAESEGRQIILSVAGEDRLGDLTKLSMQVDAAVRLIREAGKAGK